MKVIFGWVKKNGRRLTPSVRLKFSTISEKMEFDAKYQCQAGTRYGLWFGTTGIFALKALNAANIIVPVDFATWVPVMPMRHEMVSDEDAVGDALSYGSRNEWKLRGKYYRIVLHHKRHLWRRCTDHMRASIEAYGTSHQIYAYQFTDKSVYVGQTCNPHLRHQRHLKGGSVFHKISAGGAYELKILAEKLTPAAAIDAEIKTIAEYRVNGWILLNRHAGGGLGSLRRK